MNPDEFRPLHANPKTRPRSAHSANVLTPEKIVACSSGGV
eukprot:CAMPEP_0198548054 /NCGR_PEP_ID=MMETSP1462-20131121/68966_1 /TAXON_ID=1333877 /ORGANISM="Brandtodinium nutriculum, Strain RCC3387" /LENGTH=39 /DNA_ID= /DNA_START= /DNA_END= /DNA_ORIENTATION=